MGIKESFEYQLKFDDGSVKSYNVEINSKTFQVDDDDNISSSPWAELKFHKCENCPYDANKKKYCPVAKNLANVSAAFKEDRSYKKVTVFVKTENRMYGKSTDLQTALQSLFGLIMAASACPNLDVFKTMAHFHLPFSTTEETMIRALGMHLIEEYLLQQENPTHKISLDSLLKKYDQVVIVNRGILERIRSLSEGDANKNAITILDGFASLLPLEISSGLTEVRALYDRKAA